jgi:hypothetical protein
LDCNPAGPQARSDGNFVDSQSVILAGWIYFLSVIQAGFQKSFDSKLVSELLIAYGEAKRNFYLGGLRLSAVEGGRFCEAAFRMLEQATTGKFTPLGIQLDSERLIKDLSQLPRASTLDSIRIHIPRALRVVYDIRNKRDAAHLADGIDPNVQDATLVISCLDWVLAEFVRIYHGVNANEAQLWIEQLVRRRVPMVQNFDGFLKVLNPKLEVSDRVILLLYERGAERASFQELKNWVHPRMRKNLKRALENLEHDRAWLHSNEDIFQITELGMRYVENAKLHETVL